MKNIDILLINPPREIPQRADFPPIGLAYISSYLNHNGIRSKVIDAASFSWNKLKNALKKNTPYIVGIPCWTLERKQSFKTAKLVREVLPEVKIIIGGHHATSFPEHMFKLADADIVVTGEGEITTFELVNTLLNNGDLEKVKGITYIKDGKITATEKRDFVNDLDILPFPNYNEFNLNEYLGVPEIKGRSAAIITSRGCCYRCIYCSASKFWKGKWRERSAYNVLSEIERLYKDFKVKNFMFFDDNFTVRKERVIKICKGIIERNLNINWVAESHVSHIDKDLLTWMKKSGCYRIDYGVESGSPEILKNIKKGLTIEKIIETFKLTHEVGIRPRAYLMVGNPGEDEVTIEETVELLKRIKPYDAPSGQILWILPDTEIYEIAKTKGVISDEYWLNCDSMVYYTGEHNIKKLRSLRNQLMKGIAKNDGNLKAYIEYLIRIVYYKYPILQKLRKLIINLRKVYENIAY